jgi:LacI family transcriptional regulator
VPRKASQATPGETGTVTIHDVARHAGVSSMTVSRVISKTVNVREPLRERVMASIKALNYKMNMAARSTRAGMGNAKIGILYSNPSASFLNEVLLGSLEETSRLGCQLLLEKCTGLRSQKLAVKRLLDQNVDGIILPPPLCDSAETMHMLKEADIPVVALATAAPLPEVSAVRINDYQGALTLTRHLIGLGHRRIAFIKGNAQHTPSVVRYEGFCEGMNEKGLVIDPRYVVDGDYTYQSGLSAAEKLLQLSNRPTAIFASNDDMAAAVISIAHGMGIRIPEDLSVCGFDDTPIASIIWPHITTIHQPIVAMGRCAVSTVFDKIRETKAGKAPRPSHVLMKYLLKERESTGPAPEARLFRNTGDGGVLPR